HGEQTSPVHRGKFVREQLLCQTMPSPPPNVDVTPPKPNPSMTTRQRFALHDSDPVCGSCHRLMDPIGLGFESYDPIGRYRQSEGGLPIDDTGEVVSSRDIDGPFHGAPELAQKLAGSNEVAGCTAQRWVSYAFARDASDGCLVEGLTDAFREDGYDMR